MAQPKEKEKEKMQVDWNAIDSQLRKFDEKYALKKCIRKTAGMTIEQKSARQAFFASVVEKANPKRKGRIFDSSDKKIKKAIDDILAPFFERKKFDNKSCYETIEKIRDFYKINEEYPYTYGNAQKWLTIAMKYYVVNLFHESQPITAKDFFETHKEFLDCKIFAVDNIIEDAARRQLGVEFKDAKKWHERDNLEEFKEYWRKVEKNVKDYTPFLWELVNW